MNLANKITLLRILFIPVFIVLLVLDYEYKVWVVTGVFILLALSDKLDGYVARRRGEVTKVGGFMDPLADKLMISAALIFLIGHGVEAWMTFVIIAREFCVNGLRTIAAVKKVVIHASIWGKMKTLFQIVGVVSVLIGFVGAWWLMLLATVLTAVSGIIYFVKAGYLLRE